MQCSFYRIDPPKKRTINILSCNIFSWKFKCRVGGKKLALFLLNNGIDLFAFDFPGCGKSEGEYISLGYLLFYTINYFHIIYFI